MVNTTKYHLSLPVMPSHPHFKHSRGVQKKQYVVSHHQPIYVPQCDWYYSMPQIWCAPPGPAPVSSVFDSGDCIWHYGTVYVKETVAVAKLNLTKTQAPALVVPVVPAAYDDNDNDNDDDTESVSSTGNPSAFRHPRNVGKQNQLKYLKHGMRLRHMILLNRANHEWNEWFAAFDADTNRIIRTPDGVAFDTLRQFARLHSNQTLSMDTGAINVWTDPHFQYEDDEGKWHPLSNLKH